MKKKLLSLVLIVVIALSVVGMVACKVEQPVVEEGFSYQLIVVKANGVDASYNPNIDGEVLAQRTVEVAKGTVTVAESLKAIESDSETGTHKIFLNDTDYLVFTETTVGYSTSWFLTSGHLEKESGYTDNDYQWSYLAYNGHYSNGVTVDFVDGLETYIIVIDGYDGTIGS